MPAGKAPAGVHKHDQPAGDHFPTARKLMMVMGTGKFIPRVDILFRIFIESGLTARRAKVVGFAFILARSGRRFFIYLHSAN
jgi:hypothetical protein